MSENVKISDKKIIVKLQPGEKRNVVATWDFSYTGSDKTNKIDKFEYKWIYKTSATSKWFDGSNGSVDYPARAVEYSTPEKATLIAFAVKPVSKTHKVNDKDTSYFTASWSSWIKFNDFIFSAKTPTNQVASKSCTINCYFSGDPGDSRPYVVAEWALNGLIKYDFIKNFEYKWEYYDTSIGAFIDAPDGSGTTPDLTKNQRDKAKTGQAIKITTPKYFIATGQVGDKPIPLYSRIRFTVTPVATDGNDGAFKAVAQKKTADLEFKKMQMPTRNIKISASRDSTDFTAVWQMLPKNVQHVDTFEIEWQYDGDARSYFNNITRNPITDIWEAGGTGSVNKSDSMSVLNTNGEESLRWKFTFTPPATTTTSISGDTITVYPEVRLRIKPKCDDTNSFIEEWSGWKYYTFDVPPFEVAHLTLTAPNPLSPRHIVARWDLDRETRVSLEDGDVASFAYEWRSRKIGSDYWSTPNSGSVDYSQAQGEPKSFFWAIDFDLSSDADYVEFKIKPVARTETIFSGQFVTETYGVTTKVITVDNLAIHIYDAANRTVYASWDHIDYAKIFESGITWEQLGIPGSPNDYPAETLDSLIRSAILTNYEVVWRYYYLDTWFETSGSTTTSSNISSQYTVPEEATDISVTVKPVSSKDGVFVGAFCTPVVEPMRPQSYKFDLTNSMTLGWYEGEESTLAARFTNLKAIPSSGGAKVDITFEWSEYRYGGWESAELETISYSDSVDFLLSKHTVQEGTTTVRVRVKPEIDTLEWFGEYGDYFNPFFNTVIPDRYVDNVEVKIQKGSKRTCVATWEDEEALNSELVDSYEVEWQHSIDGDWYSPTSSTESPRARISTYDSPDNADAVRVRIKPVPKQAQYFNGAWITDIEFDTPEDITPDVPSVPTVEVIDGYTFKATVDTYDDKTSSIKFEVVDEESLWQTATIEVSLNRASFQFVVSAGHKYRVRAAGVNDEGEVGDWSNYSNDQASYPPPLSTIPVVTAISETGALITWDAPTTGTVTKYKVEYTEKVSYFDAAPEKVQNVEREGVTQAELPEIGSGAWFFRVCTVNDVGQSDWSEIVSLTLGSTPTAPTTWSSRTTAKIGDNVILYWTHNCADESAETSAVVSLTINGVGPIEYVVEPPEDGSTSYFLIESVAAAEFSVESSYTTGQFVTYEGSVYQFNTNHSAGAWNENDVNDVTGSVIANESVIEWKVQTAGVLTEWDEDEEDYVPVYGDWSTQRIVKVFSPPSLLMTLGIQNDWVWDTFNFNTDNIYDADGDVLPLIDDEVTSFPLLVYLNAYPVSQTPVSYLLSVVSNNSYTEVDETGMLRNVNIGQEIFKGYYNTKKQSFMTMLLPENIDLENGMSYTIKATVAMDSGLSAEVSRTFSVSWTDEDYILSAELSLDRDALVTYIRPFAMDENGAYPTDLTLSVFRREFDGGYVKIGSKLSNVTRPVVVDPHPSLDYARYRIVARSNTTGAISYYDLPPYPVGETGIVLQWDEQWTSYTESNPDPFTERPWSGSMIKLPYNVKVSDSNTLDLEMVEYIGRRHPVSYYGTQVGQKATWSSDIPKSDKETIYALRRLAVYLGNVYVREPNGAGYWAHIEVSFNIDYDSMIVPVSLGITRVEGGM